MLKDLFISAILPKLVNDKIALTHDVLKTLQSSQVTRKMHPYHVNVLVKNMTGMKNQYIIL